MSSKPVVQGPFGLVLTHAVVLVLLTGFVLSGLVSWAALKTIQKDEEQRFELAHQEVEDLVRSRFDRFASVLRHTRAFFTTKERVSRQDFRIFIQSVDLPGTYPDLQAVGYIDRIAGAHRAAHERDVREDGYPRYHVWPRVQGAHTLYPVKFIEPFEDSNRHVLGFDTHSEERRAAAMNKARDTGLPVLTAPLGLLQDAGRKETPGFLLLLPVYQRGLRLSNVADRRSALRGFVYAPVRAADFFTDLYRDAPIFHKGVALSASTGREPLFDSGAEPRDHFRARSTIDLYGQPWTVDVYSTAGFTSPADRYSAAVLLGTGLLITLLAAWVAYMAGRRAESQREAIEMRDEFLSICSHELRTPLTSMKLQNQLVQRTLHDDLAAGNTARFEKMVNQSARQIDRLVRLVEEMLDISRIRSGKLSLAPEELDLCQVVHETIERFGPQIQAAGCLVRVSAPDSLGGSWDRMRLEQVLVNLLSNAMKYGAGKPIDVEILHVGDKAVLSVQDQGIGIAPENQDRIFERFERAEAKSEIGGLGLGLYIVKQIVQLQGGSIRVESRPGKGSRFVVELPLLRGEDLPLAAEQLPMVPAQDALESPTEASPTRG